MADQSVDLESETNENQSVVKPEVKKQIQKYKTELLPVQSIAWKASSVK